MVGLWDLKIIDWGELFRLGNWVKFCLECCILVDDGRKWKWGDFKMVVGLWLVVDLVGLGWIFNIIFFFVEVKFEIFVIESCYEVWEVKVVGILFMWLYLYGFVDLF